MEENMTKNHHYNVDTYDPWKEFLSRTSIHGFSEISRSKSALRSAIWFMSIASCLCFVSYQIYSASNEFYVSKSYISVFEKLSDEELILPNLKLCKMFWFDWVDFSKAVSLNFSKNSVLFGISYAGNVFSSEYFDLEKTYYEFKSSMTLNNFTRISQFYRAVAKSPMFENVNEFNISDIEIEGDNFLCYTFNSELMLKIMKEKLKENVKKFKFEFWIRDSYSDLNNTGHFSLQEIGCNTARLMNHYGHSTDMEKFFTSEIQLADINIPQYLSIDEEYVEINSEDIGVHVQLFASTSKRINRRDKPCRNDVVTTNRYSCQQECGKKYPIRICEDTSLERYVANQEDYFELICPQTIHFFNSPFGCASSVGHLSSLNCTQSRCGGTYQNCCSVASEAELERYSVCLDECIPGCTTWNYYLGNVHKWRFASFKHYAARQKVYVAVEFPGGDSILSTNEISNETYEKFIGNIGGLLGVWTGASLLSILQILYLCCCGDFRCFMAKKRSQSDGELEEISLKK